MTERLYLICQKCKSPNLEIESFIRRKPTTDVEIIYSVLHCMDCFANNLTIMQLSGLDVGKMKAVVNEM